MKLKGNNILVWSFILLLSTNLNAQTRHNSPYSMYGVGISSDYSNPISFAMGGIGIAYQDYASINPVNPASFGAFTEKSFIFDAGFVMNSSKLSSVGLSEKGSYATLNHLLFGFQFTKKWKMSFGMLPYSDVGYNINTYESNDFVGEINHQYQGKGGLNKAYFANAFNVTKNLCLGIEAGFIFGTIDHDYYMLFTDTTYIFHNKQESTNKYKDFYFKYGIQYNVDINEDSHLIFGAFYSAATKIKTDSTTSIHLIQTPYDGTATIIKTLSESSFTGSTTLPAQFGFGFVFRKKNKFKLGFDFEQQQWSKYTDLNSNGSFKNSTRLAVGAEYIPDIASVFSYIKRIRYRAGFRFEKTPYYINNTQLNEFGISFGMGLPLKRSLSSINIGFEIGQFGKASNNLVKESFFKFKLGVSMFQRWFEQRKYY